MPSFPLIGELPPVVETDGWSWEPFNAPNGHSRFWLGTDQQGNRWLTKLRGSFYAYREIAFAKLAQRMAWSCQSSIFMRLDKASAEILGRSPGEVHAAHWFLIEHESGSCGSNCPFGLGVGNRAESIQDLIAFGAAHFADRAKSDFAAFLFYANEPNGWLVTSEHEFVIIDSEMMFSCLSSYECATDFESTSWLSEPDGRPSPLGKALAFEACREIASLQSEVIEYALRVPAGVVIERRFDIAPILKAGCEYAAQYCELNKIA